MRFHPFKCGSKIKAEGGGGGGGVAWRAQEIVINTSSISPDLARNGDRSLVNDISRVGLILPRLATVLPYTSCLYQGKIEHFSRTDMHLFISVLCFFS